ncbi:hypothetical protein V8C86DRAFT_2882437 [Haematococcus lacustris]
MMVLESGEEPPPTLAPVNKLSPDPAVRNRGHHQDTAGLPAPLASLDKQLAASRPSRLSLSSPTGTSASSPSRLHHSHGGVPAHHSRLHSSSPVPRRMANSPLPGSGCDGSSADSGPKPDSPVSTRSSGLCQNGFHSPTLAPTRARVQAGAGAAQGQQPLAGGRASLDAPFLPQWSPAGRSRRASQVFGLHLSVGGASLDHTSAMSGDSFGSAKSSLGSQRTACQVAAPAATPLTPTLTAAQPPHMLPLPLLQWRLLRRRLLRRLLLLLRLLAQGRWPGRMVVLPLSNPRSTAGRWAPCPATSLVDLATAMPLMHRPMAVPRPTMRAVPGPTMALPPAHHPWRRWLARTSCCALLSSCLISSYMQSSSNSSSSHSSMWSSRDSSTSGKSGTAAVAVRSLGPLVPAVKVLHWVLRYSTTPCTQQRWPRWQPRQHQKAGQVAWAVCWQQLWGLLLSLGQLLRYLTWPGLQPSRSL